MSKIEEALEKAKKLREAESTKKHELLSGIDKGVDKEINPVVINNKYIISMSQPDSPIAEEYKKLKSLIIRETKAAFFNTLMVSSATDNEGKTLTAINLAISFAYELDHSILLVDADLRNPMVHEYLGITPKYGLSDYLTKNMDISQILIKTGIGNLVIIPSGKRVKNPVELLSSVKMKSLISELKQRYVDRYIIIDTPPLLSFAESIAMGSYVDGIVFVVREGRAQLKAIKESLAILKGSNILGIVFNAVSNVNLDGHYYKRYNRYYYGRKEKQ